MSSASIIVENQFKAKRTHSAKVKVSHTTSVSNGSQKGLKRHPNKMTFYNGLVLSGGSVKILNTLGALQYAYDKDLVSGIKYYSGSSAGAIICYLLVIGYTPSEIIVDFCINEKLSQFEMDVKSMVNLTGAMSYAKIQEYLESKTIDRFGFLPTLQDLYDKTGKVLTAPTFNTTKNQLEFMNYLTHPEMPCLVALRMSSSLPFIFAPYKYNYCEYVDGALGSYMPISFTHNLIEAEEEKVGHILGLCITLSDNTSDKLLDYIYKILSIPIKRALEDELERTKPLDHDIIQIHSDSHTLAFNMATREKLELFSMGYQTAQKHLEFGGQVVDIPSTEWTTTAEEFEEEPTAEEFEEEPTTDEELDTEAEE